MPKEQIYVELTCPKCGRQGRASWRSGSRQNFDQLSAGFVAVDDGNPRSPSFQCASCRVSAHEA